MVSEDAILRGLGDVGITGGSVVFSHANLGFFGPVEGAHSMTQLSSVFLHCLKKAVGKRGTLIFPAFTYSFGSSQARKVFNPKTSLTKVSSIANLLLQQEKGYRSLDPMLSVVGVGHHAHDLTANVGKICFGPDSIWARLIQHEAIICNFNLNSGSTFLHYLERQAGVPHRTDFELSGVIIAGSRQKNAQVTYTGRNLDKPEDEADFTEYHKICLSRGITQQTNLGRGTITAQSCAAAGSLLTELLPSNPSLLTRGQSLKKTDN